MSGKAMAVDIETVHAVCPKGRLRAALNFGNGVLVGRDGAGRPQGITVDRSAKVRSVHDRHGESAGTASGGLCPGNCIPVPITRTR